MSKYKPEDDGVTHINIYSKGKTVLGRNLSNFAYYPIKLPEGIFNSVESYWYYLLITMYSLPSREDIDILRMLSGFQAKKIGKQLLEKYSLSEEFALIPQNEIEFRAKIIKAFNEKLEQHLDLKATFVASDLPFTHYYVYGTKIIESKAHQWQVEVWERIRKQLKEGLPYVT